MTGFYYEKTKLEKTSLEIPAMALGIMRMSEKSPEEAAKAIETAFDNGMTYTFQLDINCHK